MNSAQQRSQAIQSAIANNRLSGFVPTPFGMGTFDLWIEGAFSTDQAVKRIVEHYKNSTITHSDGLAEPNKLGITDSAQLRRFEADVTTLRLAELSPHTAEIHTGDDELPGGYDPKAIELLELEPTPRDIERQALLRELQGLQGPDPMPLAALDKFLADREAFFDQVTISASLRRQCEQWIRGGYIAGDWGDIERIRLIVEVARFRTQRQTAPVAQATSESAAAPTPKKSTGVPPPPPDGYASWLDYAVLTMDTRWPSLEHMFDDDYEPPDRQAMDQAVQAELRELRARAGQAPASPPLGRIFR